MIERSKDLMVHAGATWVLWLLVALSIVALTFVFDRLRVFHRQRAPITALVPELHRLLSRGDVETAARVLKDARGVASAVALAGLAQWRYGRVAVEEAMSAALGLERTELERRLLFLGTIGSNAPFVGLLGTVIGIVGAFDELSRTRTSAADIGALAPEGVMATIAEALVVTAVGLIVAIPAVALFNYFQGKLNSIADDARTLGHVLLAHVEPSSGRFPMGANDGK